ncbi:competence/damage-inducible protein A [Aerococcaceae bacterium DSM 109652]|uniref:Putative competence-damage inducible protein n=2 Tax=Fundicoccus ignavus TaxID=2664442 RepID=A0A844C763_9LACT|nr:competence/damage-inducible protein A [Fundicoccus ignavus]
MNLRLENIILKKIRIYIEERKMKAEIIAIGTELLMGYVVNTNASYISQSLLDIGIGTYYQQVVGDNDERILEALALAASRSDLIILSGGIGPTRDDRTKLVLAEFLEEELSYDADQLKKVEMHYKENNRIITEGDYQQALTISDSQTFFNEVGLASGLGYSRLSQNTLKSQHFIVLPGPPFEMKHMMENFAKPFIENQREDYEQIESLYINFYGLGEARVAQAIDDLIVSQTNPTLAIYAKPRLTTVRITASASNKLQASELNQQAADKIIARLSEFYIGAGEHLSFEASVLGLLKEKKQTLSVAESLTGGMVMEVLTAVSGASEVLKGGFVTYQNELKINLLGVNAATIDQYTVVSAEVAMEMAEQCLRKCHTDYALSLTGVAGPNPLEGHPAGRVFIALAIKQKATQVIKLELVDKPRDIVREISKHEALNLLRLNAL